MVSPNGTPALCNCTYKTLPKGVEIVGNGTLTHPLDVRLSGAYAIAPELLATLERLARIADEGAVMVHETGKPTWSFIDEVKQSARAAISKAPPISKT